MITDPTEANDEKPFIFSIREAVEGDDDEVDEFGLPIIRIDPESESMQRLYLDLGRIVSLGALLEWRMAGVWMKLTRSLDPSSTQGKTFRQSWNGSADATQAIGGEVENVARPVLDLAMSAWLDRGKLIHGNWLPGELVGYEVGTYFLMNPRRSGVVIDTLTHEDVQQIIAKLDDAVSKVVRLDESLHLVEVDD